MATVQEYVAPEPVLGSDADLTRLRVLVVDDHPAVRLGLLQLLDDQPDLLDRRRRRIRRGGQVDRRARADRCRGRRLSARLA